MTAKPASWLWGVADILRSDSHDLRELAILGGLDPRTAYIGTNMRGADVRGQDLRGMIFTHLDKSQVRWNNKTKWPDDPSAPNSEI